MICPQIIRPLPARTAPLPGESLISLVRRTAHLMDYRGMRQILDLAGVGRRMNPNCVLPDREMGSLATLVHRSVEQLTAMSVHHFASQLVLLPRDSVLSTRCDPTTMARYFLAGAYPVCPLCLAEDTVPYERSLWSFRPLSVCLIHGCTLVSRCPACRRPLRRDRPTAEKCSCGVDLRGSGCEVALPAMIVAHLRMLPRWLTAGDSPIAGVSMAACFFWADRLVRAFGRTAVWIDALADAWQTAAGTPRQVVAWAGAVEILEHWPDRFHQFLDACQKSPKPSQRATGTTTSFGPLPVLAAKLERMGYAAPAAALRNYLLEHFTAGVLSHRVALFRGHNLKTLLAGRPWLTHTEAAHRLGVRHAAIADLVRRNVLAGEMRPAGKSRRLVGVVSRTSVEQLKRDLRDSYDCRQAAKRLGIFHKTVWQMAQQGVLARAVRTAEGWRIPRSSVTALLETFRSRPAATAIGADWIAFRQAIRRLGSSGMTVVQLLKDLSNGMIQSQWNSHHRDLRGIVVNRTDLSAAIDRARQARHTSKGYSLREIGQVLFPDRPMTFRLMRRWLRLGLVRARRAGHKWLIALEEVQRVRDEYCLAVEACRILGIRPSTLVHWRAQGKLEPIYGRGAKIAGNFSLYRRHDVLRLVPSTSSKEDP